MKFWILQKAQCTDRFSEKQSHFKFLVKEPEGLRGIISEELKMNSGQVGVLAVQEERVVEGGVEVTSKTLIAANDEGLVIHGLPHVVLLITCCSY